MVEPQLPREVRRRQARPDTAAEPRRRAPSQERRSLLARRSRAAEWCARPERRAKAIGASTHAYWRDSSRYAAARRRTASAASFTSVTIRSSTGWRETDPPSSTAARTLAQVCRIRPALAACADSSWARTAASGSAAITRRSNWTSRAGSVSIATAPSNSWTGRPCCLAARTANTALATSRSRSRHSTHTARAGPGSHARADTYAPPASALSRSGPLPCGGDQVPTGRSGRLDATRRAVLMPAAARRTRAVRRNRRTARHAITTPVTTRANDTKQAINNTSSIVCISRPVLRPDNPRNRFSPPYIATRAADAGNGDTDSCRCAILIGLEPRDLWLHMWY
jgi:hypothetical protein